MDLKRIINPWQSMAKYNCFGCSPDNPFGLHLCFYEDGDNIVTEWEPSNMARHAARRHSGHFARRTLRLGCDAQTANRRRNVEDGDALPPPGTNQQRENHNQRPHSRTAPQYCHYRCANC